MIILKMANERTDNELVQAGFTKYARFSNDIDIVGGDPFLVYDMRTEDPQEQHHDWDVWIAHDE